MRRTKLQVPFGCVHTNPLQKWLLVNANEVSQLYTLDRPKKYPQLLQKAEPSGVHCTLNTLWHVWLLQTPRSHSQWHHINERSYQFLSSVSVLCGYESFPAPHWPVKIISSGPLVHVHHDYFQTCYDDILNLNSGIGISNAIFFYFFNFFSSNKHASLHHHICGTHGVHTLGLVGLTLEPEQRTAAKSSA